MLEHLGMDACLGWHGRTTFEYYYSAHIWNLRHNNINNSTEFDHFNLLTTAWKGLSCQYVVCTAFSVSCTLEYIQ